MKPRNGSLEETLTNTRILELIRGYVAVNSDDSSRPDMNNEKRLMELVHLVLDDLVAKRRPLL